VSTTQPGSQGRGHQPAGNLVEALGSSGVILTDSYDDAGLPDPVLDPSFVLALARRHDPSVRELLAVDESGGEARTYMLAAGEGELVLKTQRPHRRRARTSLAKEAYFLRHLAALPGTSLSIPGVVGLGHARRTGGTAISVQGEEASGEVEYTLMTRIPGDAVERASVEGAARREVLLALGAVLRRIHEAPQEPLLASGLFPGDRVPGDLMLRLEMPALNAAHRLANTQVARLLGQSPEYLVQQAMDALPETQLRVALHSNPSATHTFVDPATGTFTGLIDFGDAYVSHPALDLRRWGEHEDRLALLEGYRHGQASDGSSPGDVDADFMRVWHVACLLTELTSLAAVATSAAMPGVAVDDEAEHRIAVMTALLREVS
jgi:hygromycin-B 7''-O-kinase